MDILNEIYFGKTNNLLKIEDLFEKLKMKYPRKKIKNDHSYYRQLNKDPILNQIGDAIANQFGFIEVIVTFCNDFSLNAYTVPVVSGKKGSVYDMNEINISNTDLKGALTVGPRGLKFDTSKFSANLLVCLNTGILFSGILTVPELIAVLLHEIGHNFTKSVLQYNHISDRVDEKFADQFVAMYGYGPELNNAFGKMNLDYDENEKKMRDIPVLNIVIGLSDILGRYSIRNSGFDEHPAIKSRMLSQIEQLKSDLKYTPDMNPKLKKQIEDEIARIENDMKIYLNSNNNDNMHTKMMKWYTNKEPNIYVEKSSEKKANSRTNPDKVNKRLYDLYNKKQRFNLKRR